MSTFALDLTEDPGRDPIDRLDSIIRRLRHARQLVLALEDEQERVVRELQDDGRAPAAHAALDLSLDADGDPADPDPDPDDDGESWDECWGADDRVRLNPGAAIGETHDGRISLAGWRATRPAGHAPARA